MPNVQQFKLHQSASQKQRQSLKLSQKQIMSVNLLAMSTQDLRNDIYEFAARNPALEITDDALEAGTKNVTEHSFFSDNTRYGRATEQGKIASDNFQSALEANEDTRKTLSEHLELQFLSMKLSPAERELGLRLIHNLDRNGFYILSPESFLHDGSGMEEYNILEATIDKIRQLDPVGTCVKNFEESLYVQAKFKGNAPEAALFILDGHFNFLNPPQPSKILKKINDYLKDTGKLSFLSEEKKQSLKKIKSMHFTEEDIQDALDFIRTLDPFPAKNFGTEQPNFISPDVYVEPVPEEDDDLQNGIVSATNNRSYKITLARDSLPSMRISRRFSSLAEKDTSSLGSDAKSEQEKADIKFARNSVQEAKTYMDSIAFRESTLEKATAEIIRNQSAFFEKGPRYLAPLRQKDIAGAIGVHEATISRMANAKYLQCQWGLFEIGYFFTNAVRTENTSSILAQMKDSPAASKEAVKFEIQSILRAHADEKKALSDQKVSDLLAEKGIIIARRTVAKYRSELNLASSYDR